MSSKSIINLTSDNFSQEVNYSEKPYLVEFCANWCNPCMDVSPIIEEMSVKYAGKVKFGMVNVDEDLVLCSNLKITGIPAIILYKNGHVEKQMIGFRSKEELEDMIKNVL